MGAAVVLLLLWNLQLQARLACKRRSVQQHRGQAEKNMEYARTVSAELAKEKEASSKLQVQLQFAKNEAEEARAEATRAREERDDSRRRFTALTTEIARLKVTEMELRKTIAQARPAADFVGVVAGGDPKRRRSA